MNIFLFVIWMITGLLVLLRRDCEVTKYEYALMWIVLMLILLRDLLI